MSQFLMLSKIAGRTAVSGATGKCSDVITKEEKQRPEKVYSEKVAEEVRESMKGSSSSYSSVRPLLNDKCDLRRHASVSRLKTPLVRFQSLLSSVPHSLCLLSVAAGPFHHVEMIKVGQIGLKLWHVAQKAR